MAQRRRLLDVDAADARVSHCPACGGWRYAYRRPRHGRRYAPHRCAGPLAEVMRRRVVQS